MRHVRRKSGKKSNTKGRWEVGIKKKSLKEQARGKSLTETKG